MAIDIVIPLGKGSRWHDNELRYSLRSLEMFGRNFGRVFIVGDLPGFINKTPMMHEGLIINDNHVVHIPATDKHGHERNIMEKLLIACNDSRVSEDFIAWQDDYFLTDETDLENYPYYYSGTIQEKIAKRITNDGYRKSMENCLGILHKHAPLSSDLFYDIHCPIIYNKKRFVEINQSVDWNIGNGYIIKSLYLNWDVHYSQPMPDLKFNICIGLAEIKAQLEGRHIFSVSDRVLYSPGMIGFLKSSYPEKSKYEK